MKLFNDAVQAGMAVRGAKFYPRDAYLEEIKEFRSFIKRAKYNTSIVSDELDKKVYEDSDIIHNLENSLKMGVKFRFIISPKNWDDFKKEHENLTRLLTKYNNQVEMYLADRNPELHYAVVDSKHVLFEERHKHGQPREVFYEYGNKSFAKELNQAFDEVITNI